MRPFVLFIMFCSFHFISSAQQDFYLLELNDVSGRTLSMKDYRGKKVLIVLSNASEPDTVRLVDIIKVSGQSGNNLVTIVVPVLDFSTSAGNSKRSAEFLSKYLKDGIIVTENILSKKSNSQQSAVMKWLSDRNRNGHFDMDVTVPYQMFAISEKGRLYAVMSGKDDLAKGHLQEILAAKVE